ncbi:unnamed protein product, partial [Oppiella nova]
ILSPICDESNTQLKIDSVVSVDNETVYYFTDDIITVVNVKTNSIVNVSQINAYFNSDPIETPIDIAFIYDNNLELISKNRTEWVIDLKTGRSTKRKDNLRDWVLNGIIAVFPTDTTGVLVASNKPTEGFVSIHLQVNPNYTQNTSYLIRNGDQIRLFSGNDPTLKDIEFYRQIDTINITNAYKIGDTITFIANRFSVDVSKEWSQLVVKDFVANLCPNLNRMTPRAPTTTTATTIATTPSDLIAKGQGLSGVAIAMAVAIFLATNVNTRDFLAHNWIQQTVDTIQVRRITGGLSNQLYYCGVNEPSLTSTAPQEVAIRLYGNKWYNNLNSDGNERSKDRSSERLSDVITSLMLSETQLGPKIYGLFEDGQILHYYHHRQFKLEEQNNPKLVEELFQKIARVHALDVPLPKKHWLFREIELNYEEAYKRHPINELIEELSCETIKTHDLKTEIQWLKDMSVKINSPLVFAHND